MDLEGWAARVWWTMLDPIGAVGAIAVGLAVGARLWKWWAACLAGAAWALVWTAVLITVPEPLMPVELHLEYTSHRMVGFVIIAGVAFLVLRLVKPLPKVRP